MANPVFKNDATAERAMSEIAKKVEDYCAERHELTVIAGITHGGTRHIRSFRSSDAKRASVAGEKTVYEIGSFSNVFTTALLAVMESKGMISLDDTTSTAGVDRIGRVLARMVDQDVRSCYLQYRREDLYEQRRVAELARPRRSGWAYSIIRMSVLGHVLDVAAGQSYERLLREFVCEPLGLHDTAYRLTEEQLARVVRGDDETGRPSPVWYWDVMVPQGGLRSTLDDMLAFAEANLRNDGSQLSTDLRRARETHFEWPEGDERPNPAGGTPPFRQALGWRRHEGPSGIISSHGGATRSSQSYLGVCEQTQTGLVAFMSSDTNLDDIHVFPAFADGLMHKAMEVVAA
ncbi:serine hydrolase domain-containing protein [Sphaerisporangium sp. NPDC051017]|uniref:serine hydrolase domain-containing protein n=1 Tax=Sphaerisporangium sp. NPDC051017 TaxID=3154636 RepID=UPI003416C610